MTSVSQRTVGFTSSAVYRRLEPHAFSYLSERATFWIAILSVFAFVTGNMIGQHGWAVFWKSVMGEGIESTIVFTGMVPPVAQIPDFERWGRLGGDVRTHTFRQAPKDLLVPLPRYVRHENDAVSDTRLRTVYFTEHLGTYATGRGQGSHPGVDISMPEGTPVVSVANGIVFRAGDDPGGFGAYIVVKHPNIPDSERADEMIVLYSVYAHLSEVQVQEGAIVMKGEQIGLSGSTGNASAPHLHFQMDRESAPFHPYWPFTGIEQRQAQMTFSQAVDEKLGRINAEQHTLDPMLAVQSYERYVEPVIVDKSGKTSFPSVPRRMMIADRKAARLSKIGTVGSTGLVARNSVMTTMVAFTDSAPAIQIPYVQSSSALAATTEIVQQDSPQVDTVRSVRISHDGIYNKTRGWEKITLMLLDKDGRLVTQPSSQETLHIQTAYGRAEFKPSVVPLSYFRNGVFTVEMLPLGEQTIVVQVQPTMDMSKPMKYVR